MRPLAGILLLTASIAAAALFTNRLIVRPWRCDTAKDRLLRMTIQTEKSPSQHEISARARKNIDELRRLLEQCPAVPDLYMALALNEQLVGRYEEASVTYGRLLEIEQRPEIYSALGNVLVRLGRYDEAVEAYVKARRFSPRSGTINHIETRRRVRERLRQELEGREDQDD
ncbi:MAG TPA: tetratricopeptide repeat protein [Thermoanaerobaculia bacterium]